MVRPHRPATTDVKLCTHCHSQILRSAGIHHTTYKASSLEFHCIYSYSVRISDWAACSPDRSRSGQPGLSSV
eukprot:COSAG03_NODE_1432_length_4089_cov_11.519298_4_plen_72_part_00